MRYTGPIFRPPVEAMLGTKILQVTVGCAHNECHFCTMYKSVKFSTEPMEQIEEDIKELRETYSHINRIFLVNGDAFVLSAKRLKAISDKIIEYIPEVEVISMYASVTNVKDKTDEELAMMKDLRINDLWMGTETGNREAIELINKGHTLEDAYEQLERLNKFGIRHNDGFMHGVAGHGKGVQNAIDTAKLINETKPSIIWFGTLGLFEGSKMRKDAEEGRFIQATELEILVEELKVLELIELENVAFYGIHPTNSNSIHGILPQDKDRMIRDIKGFMQKSSYGFLNSVKRRDSL